VESSDLFSVYKTEAQIPNKQSQNKIIKALITYTPPPFPPFLLQNNQTNKKQTKKKETRNKTQNKTKMDRDGHFCFAIARQRPFISRCLLIGKS